jgi:leader peptidase (prepilin peptidase)/N-methyltransferase
LFEIFFILLPYFPWIFFGFGAIWGSFANVVISRWPHMSVVKPRSRCPKCKTPIAWYDNVPILSWIFLRGKCRHCKKSISIRYPLVELIMACLFTAVYYRIGVNATALEYLIFIFGLVTVSFIDLDQLLLPDVFTLSGIVIGLVGAYLNPQRQLFDAILGVLLGGGFLWSIAYFYFLIRKEEGMGGGDIKLLAWIGALLGWKAIPFVILCASIIGSVVGIMAALRSKKGMKTVIPFGPYLALGAVIFIFGGQSLAQMYLHLFIPGID